MTESQSLTLLVVDDEPAWVGALGAVLGKAGHRIVAAYDGDEALRRFRAEPVDAVLLDLAMPGLDGAEVCRLIRAESDTPIIIISGERDRSVPAELLDLGADDYVRKGVPSVELLARIRAVVRRRDAAPAVLAGPAAVAGPESVAAPAVQGARAVQAPPAVQAPSATPIPAGQQLMVDADSWRLDLRRHEIYWQASTIPATAIEFRLLATLIEHLGELVTHANLLAAGWPEVPDPDPLWLKPHLARLRDKLAAVGAPGPVAVRSVGYRLEA